LDFDPDKLIKSMRIEDLPESLQAIIILESNSDDTSANSNQQNDSDQNSDSKNI